MKQEIIAHFKKVDPIILEQLKDMDFEVVKPLLDHTQYFAKLCRTITGQQLSVKAAATIHSRFLELVGGEPTPLRILELSDDQLRAVGLSRAKTTYIKDLATKTENGELALAHLPTLTEEEVAAELVKVKGIGQWTAEMFLMFTLGRPNVFSYGDLGLLRGLQKLYSLGEKPTNQEIASIVDSWAPYKSYGSYALWHSLKNSPR